MSIKKYSICCTFFWHSRILTRIVKCGLKYLVCQFVQSSCFVWIVATKAYGKKPQVNSYNHMFVCVQVDDFIYRGLDCTHLQTTALYCNILLYSTVIFMGAITMIPPQLSFWQLHMSRGQLWVAPALHCTSLHCTALHCTALQCNAMHITAHNCNELHCFTAALQFTALYCTALHCSALHCSALHCTAMYSTALFCTVQCFTVQYSVPQCSKMQYSLLQCTNNHSNMLFHKGNI